MKENALRQRVIARLAEIGLGAVEAAERVEGLERNYIRDLVEDKKRSFNESKLELVAEALQWTVPELRGEQQKPVRDAGPSPTKFIRNRSFKFYVRDWREFMGVKSEEAARAAGLDAEQYEAFEHFPINFNLQQVVALADVIGVRGDQFWFPPPARPAQVAPSVKAPRKINIRGRK